MDNLTRWPALGVEDECASIEGAPPSLACFYTAVLTPLSFSPRRGSRLICRFCRGPSSDCSRTMQPAVTASSCCVQALVAFFFGQMQLSCEAEEVSRERQLTSEVLCYLRTCHGCSCSVQVRRRITSSWLSAMSTVPFPAVSHRKCFPSRATEYKIAIAQFTVKIPVN